MLWMLRAGYWGTLFCWFGFAGISWLEGTGENVSATVAEFCSYGFAITFLFAAWRLFRREEHWGMTLLRVLPLLIPWFGAVWSWSAVFSLICRIDRGRFRAMSIAAGVWCLLDILPAGLWNFLYRPLFFLLLSFAASELDRTWNGFYRAGFWLAFLSCWRISPSAWSVSETGREFSIGLKAPGSVYNTVYD